MPTKQTAPWSLQQEHSYQHLDFRFWPLENQIADVSFEDTKRVATSACQGWWIQSPSVFRLWRLQEENLLVCPHFEPGSKRGAKDLFCWGYNMCRVSERLADHPGQRRSPFHGHTLLTSSPALNTACNYLLYSCVCMYECLSLSECKSHGAGTCPVLTDLQRTCHRVSPQYISVKQHGGDC